MAVNTSSRPYHISTNQRQMEFFASTGRKCSLLAQLAGRCFLSGHMVDHIILDL